MSFSALHEYDRRRVRPEAFMGFTRSGLLRYGSIAGTSATGEDTPVLSAVMNRLTARRVGRTARLVAQGMLGGRATESVTRFHGVRVVDTGSQGAKRMRLIATAGCRRGVSSYTGVLGRHAFEYPLRMGLSTLGLRVMVSASDLISRYLGLEWSSLCLYVLAAIRRGSAYSTEILHHGVGRLRVSVVWILVGLWNDRDGSIWGQRPEKDGPIERRGSWADWGRRGEGEKCIFVQIGRGSLPCLVSGRLRRKSNPVDDLFRGGAEDGHGESGDSVVLWTVCGEI